MPMLLRLFFVKFFTIFSFILSSIVEIPYPFSWILFFLFLPLSHFACLHFILSPPPPLSVPESKVKAKYLNEKSDSQNLNEKEECASLVLRVTRWPEHLVTLKTEHQFYKISIVTRNRLVYQMLLFS